AATVAATISAVVRKEFGVWAGLTGGMIFLALPCVQTQTQEVMSDLLVTLFGFCAALAFAKYAAKARTRHLIGFAVFALLAAFTKSSGLYLALLPPLALTFTKRLRLLADRRLWAAGAAIGAPVIAWGL